MISRVSVVLATFVLAVVALFAPSRVVAAGVLGPPVATPAGAFGGIAYIEYNGIFEGQTSTGAYRVPYQITAPQDRNRGNRTVLVEPPHVAVGLVARDINLGRDFLFTRGFAHAGIGWSTVGNRILDPAAPDVFINGGFLDEGGRTDDEIIADFARALAVDGNAQQMLGRVDRRYITGVSDSSAPVMRLVTSGRATGAFELALPYTVDPADPQAAIAAGLYNGKLIIFNSEFEGTSANLVDRGVAPDQYRFYAVAGAPHIPDVLVPFPSNMTTPASFEPELRAHFLQGDDWVKGGKQPPSSTHLETADGVTLARDGNGNAIAVRAQDKGNRKESNVPRLPYVELGEARYLMGLPGGDDGVFTFEDLLGSYSDVKAVADFGFKGPDPYGQYLKAFDKAVADYVKAGYMLDEDANAMRSRAALCPPLTYTETYREHYDNFTTITPCN